MAAIIGVILGLASLIVPWLIWAKNWHSMELYHKAYLLFIPSIGGTIAILVCYYVLKELVSRGYARARRVKWVSPQEDNRFDNLGWFLWFGVYFGLYLLCEWLFN